jgi:hypothetical protein
MSDPKLEDSMQQLQQALLEEQKAQSHLDSFASTTPLSPTEDVEATDADALRRAIETMRAATEHRKKKQQEYHELLQQRDQLQR